MSDITKIPVGFKESKEALAFVFALVKGVKEAKADGQITISDFPDFLPALMALPKAFDNMADIPVEFAGVSPEEAIKLKAWVKEQFDIDDDQIENMIEGAFAVIIDLWAFLNEFVFKTVPEETKASEPEATEQISPNPPIEG